MKYRSLLYLLLLVVFYGCKSEPIQTKEGGSISIWLKSDPDRLNPLIQSKSLARDVYMHIFYQLADFDPETRQLVPIIASKVPEVRKIESGPYAGKTAVDIEIRPEAKWDDGEDITSEDVLFTFKVAFHPQVEANHWRQVFDYVEDIQLDESDPKKCSVISGSDYFLIRDAVSTINLFPEHIYDPNGALKNIDFSFMIQEDSISSRLETDSSLVQFAMDLNGPKFTQQIISGSGPYEFLEWESNQYVRLKRKDNWWGKDLSDNSYFEAYPSELVFKIIKDEMTAFTALKSGELDLKTRVRANNWKELSESDMADNYNFLNPQLMRYYYLAVNNRSPKLSKNVRLALSHLIDIDYIIDEFENGNATPVIGHFNPIREYYNNDIERHKLDLEKAKVYLDEDGWKDSDGNGILDKMVDESKVELSIQYLSNKGQLGQQVGLLFKENARKVGIEITVDVSEMRLITPRLFNGDFELAPMALTQDLSIDDPYAKWHTDNIGQGKSNWFGYGDAETDQMIETIRTTEDEALRTKTYMDLQARMYADMPAIWLYSPKDRIVTNGKFDATATVKRPGYFVNTFSLKEIEAPVNN